MSDSENEMIELSGDIWFMNEDAGFIKLLSKKVNEEVKRALSTYLGEGWFTLIGKKDSENFKVAFCIDLANGKMIQKEFDIFDEIDVVCDVGCVYEMRELKEAFERCVERLNEKIIEAGDE